MCEKGCVELNMCEAYWSLSIKIPRCRRHILRNVRVNLFPIFINLCWRKPSFTCFLQFKLLPMILSRFESHCNTQEVKQINQKYIFMIETVTKRPKKQGQPLQFTINDLYSSCSMFLTSNLRHCYNYST